MATLSVVIITKNEAHNIVRTLEAVRFANEIIIVDAESTDNTVTLAQQFTDKIIVNPWPGYGAQRNVGIKEAKGDWILCLDADEVLTIDAVTSIQALLQKDLTDPTLCAAYELTFNLVFQQKQIRYAAGSDRHVRLFRRGKAQFTETTVHESLQVTGRIGRLQGVVLHYSFRNLEQMIDKMNRYTSLGASAKKQSGKTTGVLRAATAGLWCFMRLYIFQGGFLDGRQGFILDIYFAENAYYKYLKTSEA